MARFAGMGFWRRGDDAAPQHGLIDHTQYVGTEVDDHIHGRKGPDTIDGLGGDDVLNARYGDDTLNGDGGDDVLYGSAGRDTLNGGAGNDIIYGGTERQEVGQGGAGRDQLFGGDGDDRLYGGWESDILEGGSGKDRFIYTALSDSTVQHFDVIRDFDQGKDTIVFRGDYRDANLHFIGKADFSDTPGEVRFEIQGSNLSAVYIDIDGDGAADGVIGFVGQIHFHASDFSF